MHIPSATSSFQQTSTSQSLLKMIPVQQTATLQSPLKMMSQTVQQGTETLEVDAAVNFGVEDTSTKMLLQPAELLSKTNSP